MGKNSLNKPACFFAFDTASYAGITSMDSACAGIAPDAACEISSAVESAQDKSWPELHSLDTILAGEENDSDGAEIAESPVEVYESGAAYNVLAEELPENYKHGHYIAAGNEDSDPVPDYSFRSDDAWIETEKKYAKEIEAAVTSGMFNITHQPHFSSSAEQDRYTYHKIELGAWAFALYDLEKRRH